MARGEGVHALLREGAMSTIHPAAGERVLGCPHAFQMYGNVHWYKIDATFQRPDGTTGQGRWQIACDACVVAAGGDPYRIPITCDGEWDGTPVRLEGKA